MTINGHDDKPQIAEEDVFEVDWFICDGGHVHLSFKDENGKDTHVALDVESWLDIADECEKWLADADDDDDDDDHPSPVQH